METYFISFFDQLRKLNLLQNCFHSILAAATLASASSVASSPQPKVKGQNLPEYMPPLSSEVQRTSKPGLPPLPPEKRVGFAVIGLGRLSLETILPAFAECKLAKLTAVMTGDPKGKGKRVASEYGLKENAIYGYEEWARLQKDPHVQVVYIVTPNSLHKDQVLHAAAIGKHVLCEKPIATHVADAEAMIQACAQAGVKLMVAYRCQYEPHHLAIRDLVKEGKFGKLKMIEAHNGQDQSPIDQWRHHLDLAGGGALPDIGIYCLNFSRYITNEEPIEVSSWTWSPKEDPRFKEIEANVCWNMRFPSGIVAKLSASYDTHEARKAHLYFEKAVVELDPAFSYQGIRLHVTHRDPEKSDVEIREERILSQSNQFALEMDHMAECVLNNQTPHTPGEEGLKDQYIMEAIYQSAHKNFPVSLKKL